MFRALTCTLSLLSLVLILGCGGGDGETTVADAGGGGAAPAGGGPPADMGGMAGMAGMGDVGGAEEDAGAEGGMDPSMMMGFYQDDQGDDEGEMGMDPAMMMGFYQDEGGGEGEEMEGYGDQMEQMMLMQGGGEESGDLGMEEYGAFFGAEGGAPGATQAAPETLDEFAALAFRNGSQKDAMNYLYAHALSNDEAAADLLPTMQWVTELRQPKLAVRWGFGIDLTAPRNFDDDPKAIGTTQQIGGETGGRGGGEGDFADYGAEFESGAGAGFGEDFGMGGGTSRGGASNATISKYTGELGEQLLAAFDERIAEGKFGRVLQDARGSGGAGGGAGGGLAGYGDVGGEDFMAAGGGIPGGFPGGPSGSGGAAAEEGADAVASITPGLTFLGIGKQKELNERAKDQDIDLLVVFDVEIKLNVRQRQVINETGVIVYNLNKSGRDAMLVRTRPLNNVRVQVARRDEKDDGLEKEIAKITSLVDKSTIMVPLPEGLNKDNVGGRISLITSEKTENPLAVLAEIKFWNRKDLLDDALTQTAFARVVGDEVAATLVSGSEEEKKAALQQWLPSTTE